MSGMWTNPLGGRPLVPVSNNGPQFRDQYLALTRLRQTPAPAQPGHASPAQPADPLEDLGDFFAMCNSNTKQQTFFPSTDYTKNKIRFQKMSRNGETKRIRTLGGTPRHAFDLMAQEQIRVKASTGTYLFCPFGHVWGPIRERVDAFDETQMPIAPTTHYLSANFLVVPGPFQQFVMPCFAEQAMSPSLLSQTNGVQKV